MLGDRISLVSLHATLYPQVLAVVSFHILTYTLRVTDISISLFLSRPVTKDIFHAITRVTYQPTVDVPRSVAGFNLRLIRLLRRRCLHLSFRGGTRSLGCVAPGHQSTYTAFFWYCQYCSWRWIDSSKSIFKSLSRRGNYPEYVIDW